MTGSAPRIDDVTGIVLAGGRSSRFGADKLSIELDGRPLLHHALAAVASVASTIVLVVAPGTTPVVPSDLGARLRIVHDPESFGGPLVGLVAALGTVESSAVLVVGGDMPRLVPGVLRRLLDRHPGRLPRVRCFLGWRLPLARRHAERQRHHDGERNQSLPHVLSPNL